MSGLLTPRRALLLALILVSATAIALTLRTPRLTLGNQGLVLDYHPLATLTPAVCAAGLLILVAAPGVGRARLACGALMLLVVLGAADTWRFRIAAETEGLAISGVLATEHVSWKGITRVTQTASSLVLARNVAPALTLEMGSLTPQQRDTLERSIARRLREAGAPALGAAAPTSR